VSRYLARRPAKTDVVRRWLAFLNNHKEGIAAMDFFTVPTASLRILYCWFVILCLFNTHPPIGSSLQARS